MTIQKAITQELNKLEDCLIDLIREPNHNNLTDLASSIKRLRSEFGLASQVHWSWEKAFTNFEYDFKIKSRNRLTKQQELKAEKEFFIDTKIIKYSTKQEK